MLPKLAREIVEATLMGDRMLLSWATSPDPLRKPLKTAPRQIAVRLGRVSATLRNDNELAMGMLSGGRGGTHGLIPLDWKTRMSDLAYRPSICWYKYGLAPKPPTRMIPYHRSAIFHHRRGRICTGSMA